MRVSELKAMASVADVYELRPEARYLMIARAPLASYEIHVLKNLMEQLDNMGVNMVLVFTPDTDTLKFFELEPKESIKLIESVAGDHASTAKP